MTKRILSAVFALIAVGTAFAAAWVLLLQAGTLIPLAVGSFLPDEDTADTLSEIFAQLSDAEILPFGAIAAAAGGMLALLRLLCPPKGGWGRFGYAVLGIIFWLGTFAGTLLLSRINSIRVWSIVSALIDMIRGGVLEIL